MKLLKMSRLWENCTTMYKSSCIESYFMPCGLYLLSPILFKLLPKNLIIDFRRKPDPNKDAEVIYLISFIKKDVMKPPNLINNSPWEVSENPQAKYQHFSQNKNISLFVALNTSTK